MKKKLKHFLFLGTAAIGSLHLVNRFINNTAEMKNILNTENGNFYHWKSGNVYYRKYGDGSPVLLIHDLSPESSSYEWCRFAKKLEKKHTVYALDLPGCGRSDKPHLTYTNYFYVMLLTDFIRNVIKESPDVIVTNTSVSFVTLASNMEKDLIRNIIAINPPEVSSFDRTPGKYSNIKKYIPELPVIGTFYYHMKMLEPNIKKLFYRKFFHNTGLISSKMPDAYYEAAHIDHSHGKYLFASIQNHYTNNTIKHALKKLEIPFYIIESSNLPGAIANVDSYKRINTQIHTDYLANAGLLPQLEMPDRLMRFVEKYIAS